MVLILNMENKLWHQNQTDLAQNVLDIMHELKQQVTTLRLQILFVIVKRIYTHTLC